MTPNVDSQPSLFYAGERLKCAGKSGWGLGQVLEDTAGPTVDVFFEYRGRKCLNFERVSLVRVETGTELHPVLEALMGDLDWKRANHNIYVVLLEKAVLNHRRFRDANPQYQVGKLCLYVGMTGLLPEVRFRNHKSGYKANYYVHQYGIRLLSRLFQDFNPMPYLLAGTVEAELAKRYRSLGYGVWQH